MRKRLFLIAVLGGLSGCAHTKPVQVYWLDKEWVIPGANPPQTALVGLGNDGNLKWAPLEGKGPGEVPEGHRRRYNR